MTIEVKQEGDHVRAVIHGNVDLAGVDNLRASLSALGDLAAEKIILDFVEVEFVDSAGLGALVTFYRAQKDKTVVFANVNDRVKKLFQITRLDSLFRLEDD